MGLDLVELLEGAIHVDRIDVLQRHAVGEERRLEHVDRMLVQGAAAREFLHVPEIGPVLRPVLPVLVGAVGDDRRVDVLPIQPGRFASGMICAMSSPLQSSGSSRFCGASSLTSASVAMTASQV